MTKKNNLETLKSVLGRSILHYSYDYFRADWDGLRDHLRDVPWEDIFKLSASAAASEFCEWVQVGIDAYIPYRMHQASFISIVFCSLCCYHSSQKSLFSFVP